MTTNNDNNDRDDDDVIDIFVNVNATDRAIDAIRLDADIVPDSDDVAIQLLITLRNASPDARKAIVDDVLMRRDEPTDD